MNVYDAFDDVLREYRHSVDKHGDWQDYTVDQMMAVIVNELMVEAGEAELRGDLYGEHGVVRELTQVAACCMKAVMVLSARAEEVLAETFRTEGAHSDVKEREFPASLTHPRNKESVSNSPEEGRVYDPA